jgi:hypothetical protein
MRQYELDELTKIYEDRGLPERLAKEVAMHLTKNDGELLPRSSWLHMSMLVQRHGLAVPKRILWLQKCTHALELSAASPDGTSRTADSG